MISYNPEELKDEIITLSYITKRLDYIEMDSIDTDYSIMELTWAFRELLNLLEKKGIISNMSIEQWEEIHG